MSSLLSMDGHCCESVPHSIAAYWFLLHSIAMAVAIDYSIFIVASQLHIITIHHLSTFSDSRSPVLCWSRCQTLWYASTNSRYVYKLINSITSLVLTSYPHKERVWWHKPKFLSLLKYWRLATVGVSRVVTHVCAVLRAVTGAYIHHIWDYNPQSLL